MALAELFDSCMPRFLQLLMEIIKLLPHVKIFISMPEKRHSKELSWVPR